MSDAKHTAGVWWVDDDGCIAEGHGDDYKTIANVVDAGVNPSLIAAAPELLAALQCAPIPPSDFDTEEGCREYAHAIMTWLDTKCAKAIEKAEERNES